MRGLPELVAVALVWGVTNVLLKRFGRAQVPIHRNWRYVAALAANAGGSVLYYRSLQAISTGSGLGGVLTG